MENNFTCINALNLTPTQWNQYYCSHPIHKWTEERKVLNILNHRVSKCLVQNTNTDHLVLDSALNYYTIEFHVHLWRDDENTLQRERNAYRMNHSSTVQQKCEPHTYDNFLAAMLTKSKKRLVQYSGKMIWQLLINLNM